MADLFRIVNNGKALFQGNAAKLFDELDACVCFPCARMVANIHRLVRVCACSHVRGCFCSSAGVHECVGVDMCAGVHECAGVDVDPAAASLLPLQ